MTENLEGTAGCPMDLEEAERKASEDVIAEREESLGKTAPGDAYQKEETGDPLQFEMSIQAEDLSGYVPALAGRWHRLLINRNRSWKKRDPSG